MTEQPMPPNDAPPVMVPLTPKAPAKAKTMAFPEAMGAIILGKRIARLSWSPAKDYGLMKDGWLTIFTKDKFHTWNINDGDMEARDWICIDKEN